MNLFANPLSGWITAWGIGLLALGLWLLQRRARLWFRGVRVQGEVCGWTRQRFRGEVSTYHLPHARFRTPNGQAHEFRSSGGGDPGRFPLGAPVSVLYAPNDPRWAEIAWPLNYWRAPLGVLLFGVALLAVAARSPIRRRPTEPASWPSFPRS